MGQTVCSAFSMPLLISFSEQHYEASKPHLDFFIVDKDTKAQGIELTC